MRRHRGFKYRKNRHGGRRRRRSRNIAVVISILIIIASVVWLNANTNVINLPTIEIVEKDKFVNEENIKESKDDIDIKVEDDNAINIENKLEETINIEIEDIKEGTDPKIIITIPEIPNAEPDLSNVIIRKDRTIAKLADPELIEESKLLMLDLINKERTKHNLTLVKLGNSSAAQSHADDMIENCFLSHWGIDGMKPYMRHSMDGGYQYNAENISGYHYCVGYGYVNETPNEGVKDAMYGLMASPGHRDNILDPHHRFVSIGVTNDNYNTFVVQLFEYDYIEFDRLPKIKHGVLSFSSTPTKQFDEYTVDIYYDQQPYNLTAGQLLKTYCYELGKPVISLREQLTGGWYYDDDLWMADGQGCNDPYDVNPSTPTLSPGMLEVPLMPKYPCTSCVEVSYKDAELWNANGGKFVVSADIGNVLRIHGNGVYTVVIGGWDGGFGINNYVPLAEYSIFYKINE